jgi:hypothetical protein
MKLKLKLSSKTMPTHYVGTSLKTGKPYDFVSCWAESLDEKGLGHRINLDPTEWNAFVADGYCERDCLIVETTGEGKPRVDVDGKPITRKSPNGIEYVVMDFPAVAFDAIPVQKLRGLPLKLAEDLPKGGVQNAMSVAMSVAPTAPKAPKAPETPEEAVAHDGTEQPKAPETAMTDAGSVAPM